MKHFFIDDWDPDKYKNPYVQSVIDKIFDCDYYNDQNVVIDFDYNIDLWDMALVAFITLPDDNPHVKDFEADKCGIQWDLTTDKLRRKWWPEITNRKDKSKALKDLFTED